MKFIETIGQPFVNSTKTGRLCFVEGHSYIKYLQELSEKGCAVKTIDDKLVIGESYDDFLHKLKKNHESELELNIENSVSDIFNSKELETLRRQGYDANEILANANYLRNFRKS